MANLKRLLDGRVTRSAEETIALGEAAALQLEGGEVLALTGGLGAGKTHFVKGLAKGLACAAEASSPTFTLVHEYPEGRLPLHHLDFYRLENEEDVAGLGFEDELLSGAVLAVEWADRFPRALPRGAIWIRIEFAGDGRRIIVG